MIYSVYINEELNKILEEVPGKNVSKKVAFLLQKYVEDLQ